jgi:mono/diheme cytochrome c family protein
MKRVLPVMGMFLLAVVALPCRAADAANGKRLYAAFGCYQCHGREAQGASATGPRLGPNPIASAAFVRYVRQPTGQMPPYTGKVVLEAELADIYAFVQSVPQPAKIQDWREQ